MKRARRKPSSLLIQCIDLLALLPWWISLSLAVLSYVLFHNTVITGSIVDFGSGNPVSSALVKATSQAAKYIAPVLLLIASGLSFFARQHRKDLLKNASLEQDLSQMGWLEFELLIGEVYRRQGYKVQEFGGDGPDGGVDLVLKRPGETVLIQCKHWKSISVGVDVVRQIYGVMAAKNATACKVVISGAYTEAALKFAKDANKSGGGQIELINGQRLFALIREIHTPVSSQRNDEAFGAIESTRIFREEPPVCPKCGSGMSKHRSKKGRYAGRDFFGCNRFPDCRSIIAIEEPHV
ncbi:restriction endonuclease [Diaphorobacter sp. J5-51]|uniref:restriction endonuclease n=1 Tax=Diaphorobacter sp. J5-51 TaxID=680496 RepID=UPI000A0213DE|nr:restriction endonuclease [Diaphorobacter sp. J5-51]